MITAIELQNFKSFGPTNTVVATAPLTLLVGANGSGKTTVLEALGVLIQSSADRSRSDLVFKGDRVQLDREHAFHRAMSTSKLRLGLRVSVPQFGLNEWLRTAEELSYAFATQATDRAGSRRDVEQELQVDGHALARAWTRFKHTARGAASRESGVSLADGPPIGNAFRAEAVLNGEAFQPDGGAANTEQQDTLRRIGNAVDHLATGLQQRVTFLSEVRGGDLFLHQTGTVVSSAGRHGEDTIRLLTIAWADSKKREQLKRLEHWASVFGLPKLTGGWVGSSDLALNFTDSRNNTALPIASAGGGSKQVLPFLVEALTASSPRVFCVDEIEHGLHPALLVQLAALFAEVVGNGHQIIATTQSPTLVLAVCAEVARAHVRPDQVALTAVAPNQDGEAEVRRLAVSASGSIEDGWLAEYAEVERQLLGSFIGGAAGE